MTHEVTLLDFPIYSVLQKFLPRLATLFAHILIKPFDNVFDNFVHHLVTEKRTDSPHTPPSKIDSSPISRIDRTIRPARKCRMNRDTGPIMCNL